MPSLPTTSTITPTRRRIPNRRRRSKGRKRRKSSSPPFPREFLLSSLHLLREKEMEIESSRCEFAPLSLSQLPFGLKAFPMQMFPLLPLLPFIGRKSQVFFIEAGATVSR